MQTYMCFIHASQWELNTERGSRDSEARRSASAHHRLEPRPRILRTAKVVLGGGSKALEGRGHRLLRGVVVVDLELFSFCNRIRAPQDELLESLEHHQQILLVLLVDGLLRALDRHVGPERLQRRDDDLQLPGRGPIRIRCACRHTRLRRRMRLLISENAIMYTITLLRDWLAGPLCVYIYIFIYIYICFLQVAPGLTHP